MGKLLGKIMNPIGEALRLGGKAAGKALKAPAKTLKWGAKGTRSVSVDMTRCLRVALRDIPSSLSALAAGPALALVLGQRDPRLS